MGKYCKAYMLPTLREFAGWQENIANARKENDAPRVLGESDFLYVQDNYAVTDGIFIDENIIFDKVTPEWIEFCKTVLKFEIPDYAQGKE
jgi:hypothetical protein